MIEIIYFRILSTQVVGSTLFMYYEIWLSIFYIPVICYSRACYFIRFVIVYSSVGLDFFFFYFSTKEELKKFTLLLLGYLLLLFA